MNDQEKLQAKARTLAEGWPVLVETARRLLGTEIYCLLRDEVAAVRQGDAERYEFLWQEFGRVDHQLTKAQERIAELEQQLAEALKPKHMRVMKVPDSIIYLGDDDE